MKNIFTAGVITLALTLFGSSASAQWMYEEGEDDPFAGGVQHMAGAVGGAGEFVMFRCTSEQDLALLYVSPEKPDPAEAKLLALVSAQLRVIVDSEKVIEMVAKIDVTPDGGRYRVTSHEPEKVTGLVRMVERAKKRVAVATEVAGERVYSVAVNVRGSRNAVGTLAKGCNLP